MKTALGTITFLIMISLGCKTPQALYDGDLSAWEMAGQAEWSLSATEIVGESSGEMGFIKTTKSYDDFELNLEFYPMQRLTLVCSSSVSRMRRTLTTATR